MPTQNSPRSADPYLVGALDEYLDALHASVGLTNSKIHSSSVYTFEPQWAKKYIKIVMNTNGTASSVHAFVEIATGALLKAASWKAPQRNSDGTLAARFNLLDTESRSELCNALRENPNAFTGGYLYQR